LFVKTPKLFVWVLKIATAIKVFFPPENPLLNEGGVPSAGLAYKLSKMQVMLQRGSLKDITKQPNFFYVFFLLNMFK